MNWYLKHVNQILSYHSIGFFTFLNADWFIGGYYYIFWV
jgi:hypothetical protein